MSTLQTAQFSKMTRKSGQNGSSAVDALSISDLYSFVKTYDKNFYAGKEVHPALLNEDGTPKIFYHGTNNEFTEFDESMIGSNYPAYSVGGFYFTSKKTSADRYGRNGKTLSVYLSMSNPLVIDLDQMKNWDGSPAEYYNAADWYDNKSFELDQQAKADNNDGIYIKYRKGDLAIAFKSNQIKSATDNIGTFDKNNKDIRYSNRYTYDELVSKPDMKVTTIDTSNSKNRADVVLNAKKNAAQFGKQHKDGSVSVFVDDIGIDVIVGKKSILHSLDRRLDVVAPVAEKVGEILNNSIRINELNPREDNIDKAYALIGFAKNEKGEPYIVSFVVNSYSNEVTSMDVLYPINAKKNQPCLTHRRFQRLLLIL